MKNFTHSASRSYLGLFLKIIICTLWLLCIASAAMSLPVISQQPGSQAVCSSTNPSFTIGSVTGTTGTVTIQWQVSTNNGGTYTNITNGATYGGATTVTLTFANISTALNGNVYRCVVTDGTGSTTSNAATLSVNLTPAVEFSSRGLFTCVGAQNNQRLLTLTAGNSYQWQLSTNNGVSWGNVNPADGYTGSTTNLLGYPPVTLAMNGYIFRYIVTDNTTGCSNTSIALDTLHVLSLSVWVNPYPGAPNGSFPGSPNSSICPGGNLTFWDSANGGAEIAYKWQWKPSTATVYADVLDTGFFSGSQTKRLQVNGINAPQGSVFHIRLVASYPTTAVGCASSTNPSGLTVRTLASVSLQPSDVTTCANSDTAFRVNGAGSPTLTYQWQTDNGSSGVNWSNVGTSSSRLAVNAVTTAMNGWRYRVTIGNACSPPATSNPVTLSVRRLGTWFGTIDTKWEEARNWCGGVPDNTIDVLVPNGPVNMPNISDATIPAAFFKSIVIENAARLTISGGIVNNMTGPFDIQGTVAYIATTNQNIFPANHGSLEINGSGNKILGSHVDIARNLVLGGSAKLVTGTNILTMKTGSNPIVASPFTDPASSWIVTGNGNAGAANTGLGGLRIEQIDAADGAVLFPIGPTPVAYNPIQLTNAGTLDHFTIAVNDQLIPGGIFDAGVNRTWLVSEAVPTGSSVTLSLKWQGSEEHASFDRAQTQIIRSNGTQIVQASASAPASGINPYARAGGSFDILTQFSVASSAAVLPQGLKSFTAQKTGNATVGLTWNITGASAPKYFNVQRSNDGVHFMSIGKVNGETGKTGYNYTDNLPGTGTMYYRLQVTGQQNEMVYSGIQTILLNSANLVQLRPSAATGTTTHVYIQTAQHSEVSIYVTDITGRIHSRQSLAVNKGEHLLPIWIGGLNKGVYYVHVKDSKGNANVLTLVKQ